MKISDIQATFEFSEYSYVKEHKKKFETSELGILKSLLPIEELVSYFSPKRSRHSKGGRPELLHVEAQICLMILKSKTGLSDKELISRLNTDIHYQLFCNFIVSVHHPIVDNKILSRIRTKLSRKFNIDKFQKIIANSIKPHIPQNELKCVMSDATCYESYLRFPTNQKLLWECIDWLYGTLKEMCKCLSIRTPRTKYLNVLEAYQSFSKTRKKSHSKKRKISRRLLYLLDKLLVLLSEIVTKHHIKLTASANGTYCVIKKVLEQQQAIFNGEKVKDRIVSIFKPYIRPIVRGKEIKEVEFGAKVNAIQVGGFNFIEHLSFNAFHEGIRVPECINLHKMLFNVRPRLFAGDAIYATNSNRTFCKQEHITTNFVPKGRKPKDDKGMSIVRRELNISRSTKLEGSFGTEKNFYNLSKVKARTKNNEILWITFGIHTANYCRLVRRIIEAQKVGLIAA